MSTSDNLKCFRGALAQSALARLDVVALESRAALLDAKHASLSSSLEIRDLKLELNDLLGLPLNTQLQLNADPLAAAISILTYFRGGGPT